ncbi:hypothetical protein WICPIJ_002725 [Wickerhamomyces pijperi]|uniref:Major facilitator superfamily (MFS) profile domain-containing protein n=1 Tax=Wickerhamomyces pijperi TaxID=599730 RepID=A0A9P8TPK2_WICPI|nr:hypothetical protein WICPIJ_002725 [Wickerhamomyces pijperi]
MMSNSHKKPKESFFEEIKDFPWAQISIIAVVRLADPIAFTSLFPYVYFMVKDFHIAPTDAEISKYAGYLSSTFAFCQFLTCYQWGRFGDKYGRKPVLIIGLLGTMCSLIVFGFSKTYWQALVARSVLGLLNGNVAIARTMIGEVTPQKKHQALAFSTMPLFFQIGGVIGPMIGGSLSGKDTSYEFLKPLVQSYPYALPNIIIAVLVFTSVMICVFFLEESHWKFKYRRDYFVDAGDLLKTYVFGAKPTVRPWHVHSTAMIGGDVFSQSSTEQTPLMKFQAGDRVDNDSSNTSSSSSANNNDVFLTERQSESLVRTYAPLTPEEQEDQATLKDLLPNHIFYGIVCNFIMALHATVNKEFLPIFLAQDISRDPTTGKLNSHFPFDLKGGMSFGAQDTGRILSLTGAFGIVAVILIFPYVNRHYETLPIYKTMVSVFPVSYALTPFLVFAADWKTLAMYLTYALNCIRMVCTSLANQQITMIIHNSAPAKHRGTLNGAVTSVSALARSLGPLIWGYLFAWGESLGKGWLGWWTLSLVTLMSVYQSRYLRESEEDPNEVKASPSSDSSSEGTEGSFRV